MSYIVPFAEETDETLLQLSHELYSQAREINDEIRSLSLEGLPEEEVNHIYNLDALSSPPNIRGYLISTTDDSSRLLGAIADYIGALPSDSVFKPLLQPLLERLMAYLEPLLAQYFPAQEEVDPEQRQ